MCIQLNFLLSHNNSLVLKLHLVSHFNLRLCTLEEFPWITKDDWHRSNILSPFSILETKKGSAYTCSPCSGITKSPSLFRLSSLLMTFQLWSHCSDLGYRFGPGSNQNSTESPKSYPHFPTPGLFCDREAAVCLVVLWTLWPTTTLGFFFCRSLFLSLSLAGGDRKPQRPQSLLLLFTSAYW